jgi:hypothetical protein
MNSKLKKFAVGGIATVIMSSGGAAYAYWTTTGAGSAQGSVPSANGTISLSASVASAVAPGQSSDVTFTAVNNGATDLYVGTISSVISVSKSGSNLSNSGFSLPAVVENQIVPAHSTVVLDDKGTLSLANSASNQDQLKGATISLSLSSN